MLNKRIADKAGSRQGSVTPGFTDEMAARAMMQIFVRLSNRIANATRACEGAINKAPGGIQGIEDQIDPDNLAEFREILTKLRAFRKAHRPLHDYDRTPTGDLIDPDTGDTFHPRTGEKTGNIRA